MCKLFQFYKIQYLVTGGGEPPKPLDPQTIKILDSLGDSDTIHGIGEYIVYAKDLIKEHHYETAHFCDWKTIKMCSCCSK